MTLSDLVDRFRRSQQFQKLRPKTKANYEFGLSLLKEESLSMTLLEAKDLDRYLTAYTDRPSAYSQAVVGIRSLIRWAKQMGYIEKDVAAHLRRPKHKPIARSRNALEYIERVRHGDVKLVCLFAYYTGLRVSEVLSLRFEDMEDGGIYVTRAKTGERHYVPIHPKLANAIRDYYSDYRISDEMPLTGPLLSFWHYRPNYISAMVRQHLDGVGGRHITLHGLRKDFCCRAVEAGCSIKEVAAAVGHKTLTMVALYTAESDQKMLAKKVAERMNP